MCICTLRRWVISCLGGARLCCRWHCSAVQILAAFPCKRIVWKPHCRLQRYKRFLLFANACDDGTSRHAGREPDADEPLITLAAGLCDQQREPFTHNSRACTLRLRALSLCPTVMFHVIAAALGGETKGNVEKLLAAGAQKGRFAWFPRDNTICRITCRPRCPFEVLFVCFVPRRRRFVAEGEMTVRGALTFWALEQPPLRVCVLPYGKLVSFLQSLVLRRFRRQNIFMRRPVSAMFPALYPYGLYCALDDDKEAYLFDMDEAWKLWTAAQQQAPDSQKKMDESVFLKCVADSRVSRDSLPGIAVVGGEDVAVAARRFGDVPIDQWVDVTLGENSAECIDLGAEMCGWLHHPEGQKRWDAAESKEPWSHMSVVLGECAGTPLEGVVMEDLKMHPAATPSKATTATATVSKQPTRH